jgi:alkanesulfonate monooxygenase SsuD/methylene tetrahydromethanopterin reductase-like flavin-dependent oxidoreductase (luciferase family)
VSLRLSTVILPHRRWHDGAAAAWQRAEELGFHAAYTYDHLSWRGPFRDGAWFGAVPTLTAAAMVTDRIRLGTMVTSPNFRHPVTLAKDLLSLDDISAGRITVGIGAGTASGYDATVLGDPPRSPRERADRFAELVRMLDNLLTHPETTETGTFWTAHEARNIPGCVQQPRIPFGIASTGPRGQALAATYGQAWITTGDDRLSADGTPAESDAALARQLADLDAACADAGRDPATIQRVLLTGFTPEKNAILSSLDRFVDFAARHVALGFEELVIHWPVAGTEFEAEQQVFEEVATGASAQLG